MAAGVPVVASAIEGYSSVLTDGREGLLVPPRDVASLANAICLLLQDRELAATMGQAGLLTAAQYSWRNVAEQILDLYLRTGARHQSLYPSSTMAAWNVMM